jgi:6 kDa early secretory antigenic target
MADIKVNFGALEGLASGIHSQVSVIENELSDLKSQIANLEQLWTGSAGESFQQVKNNWNNAADDLNGVLARIATAVNTANQQYQETESKNASAWG